MNKVKAHFNSQEKKLLLQTYIFQKLNNLSCHWNVDLQAHITYNHEILTNDSKYKKKKNKEELMR